MDRAKFNSDEFDRNQAIMDDFSNIYLDESFDEGLYFTAIKSFFNSEQSTKLTEQQKEELIGFFEEVKDKMKCNQVSGKFKLPEQFYLKLISSILYSFKSFSNNGNTNEFSEKMKYYKRELDFIMKNDNRFDEKTATFLWNIYQRDDLSIGVHGTVLPDDFDISPENCDFFKNGIMVDERYKNGDARRTVNFQDLPGKQFAFGYISFLDLMNYTYRSTNGMHNNEVPMANYSCIVVRPKNMQNTAYDPECPQQYSIVSPYTHIRTNDGHYMSGHLIKPEFVLGIFKNNEEFILNPKCDLDKLSELNATLQQRNEKMAEQKAKADEAMVAKLGEETKQVPAERKKGMFNLLKQLIVGRDRERDDSGR